MKEININIEGYNVNGICVGCLNYNRKMFYRHEIKECLKLLADIDVSDGLEVQMCWECVAHIQTVIQFRDQILRSYDVLIDYSNRQTFLNSPSDFTKHAKETLSISKTKIVDFNGVKLDEEQPLVDIEVSPIKNEEDFIEAAEEVKNESDFFNFDDIHSDDRHSSDDDVKLSNLKRKKEKKDRRVKKEKRKVLTKPSKSTNKTKDKKTKSLPEDLIERITLTEEEMWALREKDKTDKWFVKLKYKCENCILGFNTEKLMQDHIAAKHKEKSSTTTVQCDICASYLLTADHLPSHRAAHTLAYTCRVCDVSTTSRRRAALHVQAHARLYDCGNCDAQFDTKSKLSYHKGVCQQQKPQCDCCGKVFANKSTLKYHLKLLQKEQKDEVKEKLYIPCKGCNKVFHSKKSYRAHVVIHDGVTYPCQVCGKQFQWKRNLARHMRNHRDKDQGAVHECRQCGKKFSSRDCLNNHMKLSRKHVNETNYNHECSYCGKKFATRWCMVDHVDWEHLHRIKYQCSFCFKAFKTAKIMVAHVNNIHEGKHKEPEGEHLCDICGKSYKSVRRLKGHVWSMHTSRAANNTYRCSHCPATFTWHTSVYKHVKMMHHNNPSRPVKKIETFLPNIELESTARPFYQIMGAEQNATLPLDNNV